MTTETVAHSMSRPVKRQTLKREFVAQVLGVFEHACDLVTLDGNVVALVVPQIGNGPFNIVVDDTVALFSTIEIGVPVTVTEEQLQLGEWRVDLKGATVWDPQPDWDTLRTRRTTIVSCLPLLRVLCHRHAPDNTFLALLETSLSGNKLAETALSTARRAGEALQKGWAGDQERLQTAGMGLAGLGNGLTPAGDDFLTGAMLWAWLTHLKPDSFCRSLLHVAAPRTTTLSAAFLRAAARGECSDSWHVLLTALSEGTEAKITAGVQKILAHGATSGADTMAGFLYLPTMMIPTLQSPPQPSPDTLSPH